MPIIKNRRGVKYAIENYQNYMNQFHYTRKENVLDDSLAVADGVSPYVGGNHCLTASEGCLKRCLQ